MGKVKSSISRTRALSSLLFFILVVIHSADSSILSGPQQGLVVHPLCAPQYALANSACSRTPYSPLPPPLSLLEVLHRGHDHHEKKTGTPEEEDCCRWLSEMDNDCVCDILVRFPDFLAKPVHGYTVFVRDICKITYTCSGRFIRK